MKKLLILPLALCFIVSGNAQNNAVNFLKKASDKAQGLVDGDSSNTLTSLSKEEVVEGLKELLSFSVDSVVTHVSKSGGFYNDPSIRIPFPKEAIDVKETAIKFGQKKKVDEFEKTLNEAAEKASKQGAEILLNAIKNINFEDGMSIVKGADSSATNYLRETSYDSLNTIFYPIVEKVTKEVELTKYWEPLTKTYNKGAGFIEKKEVNTDLNQYVTDRALKAIFDKLKIEEKLIRENIDYQVTDLLKKLF